MSTAIPVRQVTAGELDQLPGLAVNVTAYRAGNGYMVVAYCRGAVTILQAAGSEREQAALVGYLLGVGNSEVPATALSIAPRASNLDLCAALHIEPAPSKEI